jgi:hypothetical protein
METASSFFNPKIKCANYGKVSTEKNTTISPAGRIWLADKAAVISIKADGTRMNTNER